MNELKPCPFCGCTRVNEDHPRGECLNCGALGPCVSLDGQRIGWNSRSPAVKQATACGDTACVIDRANHRLTAAALHVEMRRVALLEDVLRKLSFAAQITGGVAGRDENLVAAIDEAAKVLDDSYAIATEQAIAALTPLTTPVAEAVTQPITEQGKDAWLYDGYAVFEALTTAQRRFVSAEAVSAVLDAIARIQRAAPASCTGEGKT